MKRPALWLLLLVSLTLPFECGDLEETVCDDVFDVCPSYWNNDFTTCEDQVSSLGQCILQCLAEAGSCDEIRQCIEEQDDTTCAMPEDVQPLQGEGVCYWQYQTGDQWGFGCQADIDGRSACESHVNSQTNNGEWLTQWDFMPECKDIGCTGSCGPDWWSLY